MRKFAGKCLALLLALLMPLTSMPVSLAESFTSDPWGYQAQPNTNSFDAAAAKLKAIEDAVAANAATETKGAYVQVYSARVQGDPVPIATGKEFNYEIGFMLNRAPVYIDATGEPQPAYTQYEDVEITFTVPEGIVVLDAGREYRNPETYTISLGDLSIPAGGLSQSVTVRARIDNNGDVKDGTVFDPLGNVTITANVSVEGVTSGEQVTTATRTFTYTLPEDGNQSAVTSDASGDWMVTKEQTEISEGTDEVTITWEITAGKAVNEAITSNISDYNAYGALKFESFTLTDTLPIITGKDGKQYAPKSSSIKAPGMTTVEGGEGETKLSTDYYATTDLTAGGVNTTIPYRTVYTVTATYDKAAFVLPFGDEVDVTYQNKAQLDYALIGGDAAVKTAQAEGSEGYPTAGGTITVFEKLQLGTNGTVVDYTLFYRTLFLNGAEFDVYSEADWNNGAPKDDAQPTATLTVDTEAGATTAALAPGTYYVVQTSAPTGTEMPANEGTFQTVTVPIDGKPTLTFTNLVKDKGILEIDKVNASGAALPGAAFTLTASDGETTYPLGLDTNGHGVIALPEGTYTLSETTVPSGYVKMADKTITITEGQTNKTYTKETNNALVNYSDKGSLTINKKIADSASEGIAGTAPSTLGVSKAFTFNIYRSTTENFEISEDTFHKSATIAAGQNSVTVSDLDVVDENGDLYYYTVVEASDDDARFVYDDAQIAFDFKGEGDGVYTTTATAEFTNVLLSTLSFKKEEKTLSGNTPMDGVTFEVRSGSADGTVVAKVTTGTDGIATTKPLPIKDENGELINYYIVETNVSDGYTTVYPEDGNAEDNAWGPINLNFAETTDKTSTAIVNEKHETGLTIRKTDQSGTAIAGATFTVKNEEGKFAAISDGAVTWQDEATLTTNASGQIALSGIPNGTYTVTEVSVPDAYLSTGFVTVGETTTQGTAGQALSGSVTLDTLEQKTITFKNDKKPVLTFTKNVAGNVSGNFTFELYAAADGKPTGESLGSATVTAGGSASFTVDAAGDYFLKEESWPAGVIAPTLIHKESSTGVYVDGTDVYYGPYTLSNNQTSTQTITNTPNTGSLTINKLDAKSTETKLTGATFTVSVNTAGWSEELIGLLPSGFNPVEGETATYAMTTGATNANGQVTVGNLPIYNGDAPIEYTVTEATAPENYLINDVPQTTKLALNGTAYTASLTFNDPPMAKVVVTKTWYSQWEQDSGNKVDYALAGAQIAIFEEVEGKLVQVGDTQSTAADGTTTFEGLDGTKTYYVFELSNPLGLEAAENKELAGSVETLEALSAEAALAAYYGAPLELGEEDDNQAEAALVNVETYVQLTLNKWYQPEKNVGTPEEPVWEDDKDQGPQPLDRAKFHLYYCTLDAYKSANRDIQTLVETEEGMEAYLYSDYVYESGISNGAGPGAVVTGALPGGYVYWLNEFEAPSGFATPAWPKGLSVAFVPDAAKGNEVSYENDKTPSTSMENHPEHGPGTIRYLQVMVDKIARPEEGDDVDLPNTTFELWLTDSTYTKRVVRVARFTTGVDLPFGEKYDEGQAYMPGRGVSESIQMHKLYEDYPEYVNFHKGEEIDGVQHGEYEADFVLVETQWPANTTPQSYTYPLHIRTNSGNDIDDTLDTLDNTYTKAHTPIVNTLNKQVTVAFKKVGYSADDPETTKPLAGAEITIYSDSARTVEVDRGTTGTDGLVYFTLQPTTTYYWRETRVPNGYEAVEPETYAFTTPDYSSSLNAGAEDGSGEADAEQGNAGEEDAGAAQGNAGEEDAGAAQGNAGEAEKTDVKPLVTVKNVKYRTLQLAKENENGEQVVATLTITGTSDSGVTVNETVETKTEGYVEVELPAGTYTVAETELEGRNLSKAEQDYFALINGNKVTVTFGEDDAVETLTFENPGRGGFTLTKTDDTGKAMAGVQFELAFKAFTADDLEATEAPAANTVNGDVKAETGVTVTQQQLTTDDEGKITLENLVPGWYKLTEQGGGQGDANEGYVLAAPVVIKVTASNFGTALNNASATVVNPRKGYLSVEKAYENVAESAQAAEFAVYSDAGCTTEVGRIEITGEGEGEALLLAPGTYYVKELGGSDAWYAYANVGGTVTWLGADNDGAVQVQVTSSNTQENPAKVSFTNVGNRANLQLEKVGVQGEASAALAGAEFALYYQGETALYWNATDDAWVSDIAQATKVTSGSDGKAAFENIKLPYEAFDGTGTLSYFVTETITPDNYTPSADRAVTLSAGATAQLTGENAIVNQRGVVITITKYDKPYAVTENRGPLAGAQFTLYRMSAAGAVLETFPAQTTGADGQVQFVNLPQLADGEYYAIQETVTPTGYLQDSLELYTVANGTYTQIAAVNGYFRVATDEDVTLEAYNTPLGKIAILKYDYINTDQKPVGATFTATNDEDSTIFYKGTLRLANDSDEKILEGGYRLTGDHYVKDGVSYTIAYLTGVVPGEYTVKENNKPNGYLYTPDSDPGDPWHTTQTVTVENDGGTAVVVFANLPDPEDFTVNIDKSAEYLGEGDLLGEEYQTVKFTLSNFTSGTELPLETAVLKDETFTFKDKNGVAVTGVEWYVESVTIGAADYEDTAYAESASTKTIYATVNVKDASGGWSVHGTYPLTDAKTITFGANACQGIEIVYGNADGKLDAGFTAGEVVLTVKARQPVDNENTVPVAKIGNTASISMTYDFGIIGAEAEGATKTKSDSATAEVTIDEAPALPQVSITKTSQVQPLDGTPIDEEEKTVSPGERLAYTITLTGVSGEMENPVLADILPAGLDVVADTGLNATTTAKNLTVGEVRQAGQNIWVTTSGKLAADETLTLTILVDVLPTALIGGTELKNTAYVFNNTTVPKNANNPHGSSFADEGENGGELPAVDVPEAFASAASGGSGKALKAEATNTVASASGITIAKMVSLDNEYWVSNEELLVAEKGGNIYYRVTVTNNGTRDITNLRILDVLPYDGDGRSAWGPTLVGEVNATNGTVYYSTNSLPESTNSLPENAGTIPDEWTSTDSTGARAFLAVVDKLEKGASVTLTYTTQAPVTPDDKAYYQLAINTAHCMFAGGPTTLLSSADTKVTITPEAVSLGDRVWIDENADGIQDTNETKVPGGTTTFTLYPYMEDDPQEQMHTTANAEGKYQFTGLTPAAPQDSAARYFSDSGDVDYTSLMGSARATYQLSVQVPDGYRITTPSKTEVEDRKGNDSDFALTGETIKFYIPAGGMDDTYDVGVIRERDLTITKKGTDGRYLAGAEFAIYGPYFEEPDAISGSPIATITTGANGRAAFESSEAVYLNAYAYYVIVETSAPDNYSATNLTASGTSVVSDPKPAVTGAGIEDGNYFVLAPFKGEGMDGAASDTVTVTNGYEATGELVIKGTKVLTGETLNGLDYSFTISSEDDEDFEEETVWNAADGTFAFSAIQYTYADVEYLESDEAASHEHAYHYTVTEVDGKKDGIVYDTTPREITVTLSDNDGDGEITVNVTVEVGEETSTNATGTAQLLFTNAAEGQLSVTKTVDSNVEGDEDKPFTFTVELSNDGVVVDGTYKTTITENGATTPGTDLKVTDGKGSFTLTHGQTITIGGIPSGTAYTVTEDDYRQEGYITTSEGASGTIATGGTATASFTNDRKVGGLTVKKTIDGNGKDAIEDFTFTVTLEHAELPVDNTYGGVKFEDTTSDEEGAPYTSVGTFTLKGGEEKALTGIPAGTKYTVTEQDYTAEGYVTTVGAVETLTATGEITHGGNPTVTFKNTRKVGGLTVSKTVTGNDFDANKAFDITVTLTAPANVNLVGSYAGAQSGSISVAATQDGATWTKTFSLKNGESIEFTGLPENTAYTVSEADYAAEGYVKTVSGTEEGSIKAEATATVAYTNTRNTGDLSVSKTVTGTGAEENRDFTFTLTLTENEHGADIAASYETTRATAAGSSAGTIAVTNGQAAFTLKGGETLTIHGIPAGTAYTVTESVPTADGYTVDSAAKVGAIAAGTLANATDTKVSFTNERNVGGLTVTKRTEGNGLEGPGVQDTFEITVTLTPKAGVKLVGTVNGTELPADGTVTEGVWSKTFTLKANETVTFTGLPEDTAYTVSEKDYTAQGFVTTITPRTGSIEVADNATEAPTVNVTVINTRNVGGLTIAKNVTGSGSSANDTFTFRLELENDTVNVDGEYTMTYSDVEQPVLLTVTGGEAEITLHGGQTALIEGIPVNTDYTVTELTVAEADAETGEADENGYVLTTDNGLTGTITSTEAAYQASFTNDRKVGDLTVTKEVAGNGEDAPNALDAFEITVTLTAPTGVELVGTWKQGEASGNVAASNTFTLTDGESVELTGLPEGTSYTITEADYAANGYDSDIEPEKGEITDGASSVTVTNRLNVGDLSVLKTVTGSGAETEREFSFTLTLTNEAGVTVDNTYKTSKGTLTVTGGKATFALKGGETLTIYGIPEGTDYTVTEADPAQHGYILTDKSGDDGTIGTGLSSATFTNTRDVGDLTIEKTVLGALGQTDKAFAFTLTLTPSGNGIAVDGTYDATLYTGETPQSTTITVEDGTAEFTLAHDQRLVIHEIPAGVTYEVAEASYALEGYETSASGETGTIPATGSMPVATFTNTRDGGSLRIVKNFAGNAQIPGDTFAFTIRLGRDDGVDVNGTYNALRNGVAEQITFTGGVATVWLTGGDTFEILGILSGTNYAVSEDIPASSGYMGFGENETGTIPAGLVETTFTNARYTGNLTVRKTVAGNAAETDRSFRFTIFLRNPDGTNANGTYPMTGRSAFITFVNGYASISLAAGETATVHGILSGAYYSVSEDDANTDGYVTTASGAAGIIPQVSSAVASFLNTRDVGTEETTTSRTVYKVWNDEGNADGLRPTELVVYLLADGVSIDAATLNEANGWSARFDNLPVFNADGSQIEYQVVEAYTAEYYVRYQYAAAVINIINSHSPEEFVPDEPRDPNLLTLIEDYMVPLGGNVNMNEGDCFN